MLRSWLLIKNDAGMPVSFTYVPCLAEILTMSNATQTWSPDLQAAVASWPGAKIPEKTLRL